MKLKRDFYNRDTLMVAKELLGKILVHNIDGKVISGRIVETEAYMGTIDKAAHSYGGKRTPRVEPMYGKYGYAYVYFIYGMYYCFNVVTKEEGIPEAVLIRALEPINGIKEMSINRYNKPLNSITKQQSLNLTNGPSKLCNALKIDKTLNREDLCGDKLYIETNEKNEDSEGGGFCIGEAKRVGIDYAEEAREYLWRFFIKGNSYVSK